MVYTLARWSLLENHLEGGFTHADQWGNRILQYFLVLTVSKILMKNWECMGKLLKVNTIVQIQQSVHFCINIGNENRHPSIQRKQIIMNHLIMEENTDSSKVKS